MTLARQFSVADTVLSPARPLAGREELGHALDCIFKNAFEAIDERRAPDQNAEPETNYRIGVELSKSDGFVHIAIEDNGIGFNETVQALLFNPLFSTKSRSDNLNQGYGLYTSERVVKAMQGSIEASSEGPYKGAVFTIHLREAA